MELTAGSTRLRIDESFGARVASLLVADGTNGPDGSQRSAGEPLELSGRYSDTPHGWGAFPMAPWAGRVRDAVLTWRGASYQLPATKPPHAIHGTVARVPWSVLDVTGDGGPASSAVLSTPLGEQWPWPGRAVLRYDLEEGSLRTRLEVHADADEMPAWCGMHPWFPRTLRGARVVMGLSARAVLDSEDGIPVAGEHPLPPGAPEDQDLNDTLADVAWPATLTWPGVARLEVSADAGWAVVFTQREEAVCVEPQTAPPDAAALALAGVAAPGAPVVLEMTWRWRTGVDVGV